MAKNPTFRVDWHGGEGRLDIGTRLGEQNALFKVDVIGDLVSQAETAYGAALDELSPGTRVRSQRQKNMRRRLTAESMVGLSIESAKSLHNGDVALGLSDGRVLVFAAEKDDVEIFVAENILDAEAYAKTCIRGDKYVEEPQEADKAFAGEDARDELVNQMMGITA
jgi:hypothetical protein